MVERGQDLPSRARCKANTGDVIVSPVEGSLESMALITEEYDNVLCSTGFHTVRSDVINSETLLMFLKSRVGQSNANRAGFPALAGSASTRP